VCVLCPSFRCTSGPVDGSIDFRQQEAGLLVVWPPHACVLSLFQAALAGSTRDASDRGSAQTHAHQQHHQQQRIHQQHQQHQNQQQQHEQQQQQQYLVQLQRQQQQQQQQQQQAQQAEQRAWDSEGLESMATALASMPPSLNDLNRGQLPELLGLQLQQQQQQQQQQFQQQQAPHLSPLGLPHLEVSESESGVGSPMGGGFGDGADTMLGNEVSYSK